MSAKLDPWLIAEQLRNAGHEIPELREKALVRIRCPLPSHTDSRPSAFITKNNVFGCAVCTGSKGWSLKKLCAELNISWRPRSREGESRSTPRRRSTRPQAPATRLEIRAATLALPTSPEITPQSSDRSRDDTYASSVSQARLAWSLALARTYDVDATEIDTEASAFLERRKLWEAWNERAFAIFTEDLDLPPTLGSWPRRGYKLIVPLYNERGEIISIQSRAVREASPKTLFPKGLPVRGSFFANATARAWLREERRGPPIAILAEGLTDFLALGARARVALFSAPGAPFVSSALGEWARDTHLVLAIDCDRAGQQAVSEVQSAAHYLALRSLRWIRWPGGAKDACQFLDQFGMDDLTALIDHVVEEAL